jgi:hypothetical protein
MRITVRQVTDTNNVVLDVDGRTFSIPIGGSVEFGQDPKNFFHGDPRSVLLVYVKRLYDETPEIKLNHEVVITDRKMPPVELLQAIYAVNFEMMGLMKRALGLVDQSVVGV